MIPQGSLAPLATYGKSMVDKFSNQFGRQPTSSELRQFIFQNETNPEIIDYFKKPKAFDFLKKNRDTIGVPRVGTQIKKEVEKVMSEETPFSFELQNALDIAESTLKKSNSSANSFAQAYRNAEETFEPVFGNSANFIKYMKREKNVPTRLIGKDPADAPISIKSSKKVKNAEDRLSSMLSSSPGSSRYYSEYGTSIRSDRPKTQAMHRFLNNKYRGMIDEKGDFLSPQKFMESYVMPFKGNSTDETISNLTREYNRKLGADDINEYDEFLKVNEKYDTLKRLTDDLIDELELSGKYTKDQIDEIHQSIKPNFGHAFKMIRTLQRGRFEGLGSDPRFLRAQPAVYNVSYQSVYDNTMEKIVKATNKVKNIDELKILKPRMVSSQAQLKRVGVDIDVKDYDNQYDYLSALSQKIEQAMINKGLVGILAQSKKSKNVLDVMKKNYDDRSAAYFFGGEEKSPEQYIEMIRRNLEEMGTDLLPASRTRQGRVEGREVKPMIRLNHGGPVRMAIGGDPLQNINQQQFAPDPAIDQDFFQEAVDSGNLQAGLMSLFKVFGKPKSVATPSNVKKVEQARDPLPQAMPGEQQVAPLQAGKQDFYFKSFFLDQLNDPNAPKADYPQGWMNFLVKGKKVPNAEMLDTGITQYLEDTAQFFPNKKITREDLEAIYDSSPLGNLEVRVKNDAGRVNTVDDIPAGEDAVNFNRFTNDQGKAQHKNAGSLNIDQQAEDYFEVVINAPNLPGQEKAFIRSSHFEEPNTIGFTRVGTYKNAENETVAVIQEMQTDMLTEVRKEQERLFSFVKNLKRKRERLAAEVERDPEDLYYKNRLREFDNAYPPGVLEGLEADNLIKPFPNVVAKELIPEKTKSLDAIQKQINELAMANVEQYTDPAYKTKVFDLAQDQQTIVDQLMSMNRSANYDEKMRNIKVPSSGDTDELRRIAERDAELPNYGMKDLETFPPIPFNKQADYVDLLIKATIKASKEKGINKVAIMPADVGANARWGKREGDASKKFQNLYDKVGVQQLKNIAKKYDGVFGEEAIIDSSKAEKGLKFFNKGVDGEFQLLKDFAPTNRRVDEFLDEEIARVVNDYGPNEVVLKKEIAPGQTMEYYVKMSEDEGTLLDLTPLGDADRAENATIIIEETNPQKVKMYTITFDPSKLEEPMYMFKKKDGGTIAKDSLVSITDIYGEYGR
jgi:hypothetical protein